MNQEDQILQSWHTNAGAWTNAIVEETIESRKLVTNKAILDTIKAHEPSSLLDMGCGEGWLCRRAAAEIPSLKTIVGTDAIPALIENASAMFASAKFEVMSYQDFTEGKFPAGRKFDVISFNFSLFGEQLVIELLHVLKNHFTNKGTLIIQTLHPVSACGDQPYEDGWRQGSWNGFSTDFTDPAPWYFRTMESWVSLFNETGYQLADIKEPMHPVTGKQASVIFSATPLHA